mgnify:CR=1 FL=1
MKKVSNYEKVVWISGIASFIMGLYLLFFKKARFKKVLYMTLLMKGKLHMFNVLYAQAKHETGNFKNTLFLKFNNPFAMGCATQRTQFQDGCTDIMGADVMSFAKYNSYRRAILDRLDWDRMTASSMRTYNDYLSYMDMVLDGGYATDPNYKIAWIANYKQVVSSKEKTGALIITLVSTLAATVSILSALYSFWNKRKKFFSVPFYLSLAPLAATFLPLNWIKEKAESIKV